MALVLRLLTHHEQLAFIDALSSYGWDVDLQALTHVYTDGQWIPLFIARKVWTPARSTTGRDHGHHLPTRQIVTDTVPAQVVLRPRRLSPVIPSCDSSPRLIRAADRDTRTARPTGSSASKRLGDRQSNHGDRARLVKHWWATRAGLSLNELGADGSGGSLCGLGLRTYLPGFVSHRYLDNSVYRHRVHKLDENTSQRTRHSPITATA